VALILLALVAQLALLREGPSAYASAPPRRDARAEEQLWQELFERPSDWYNFRYSKHVGKVKSEHPDFVSAAHKEALWLNSRQIPGWVLPKLEETDAEQFRAAQINYEEREDDAVEENEKSSESWSSLFANPGQFYDYRAEKEVGKVPRKYPDFASIDGEIVLWLNDRHRPWDVPERLEELLEQGGAFQRGRIIESEEDAWHSVFEDPSTWTDYRQPKLEEKVKMEHPDFKHSGKHRWSSLWLDSRSTPSWVYDKLQGLSDGNEFRSHEEMQKIVMATIEKLWRELFEAPSLWTDYRSEKAAGRSIEKHPDFKLLGRRGAALWLEDKNRPDWVLEKLRILEESGAAFTKPPPTTRGSRTRGSRTRGSRRA